MSNETNTQREAPEKEERGWLPEVLHRASLESLSIRWVQDKATDQELRDLRDRIAAPKVVASKEEHEHKFVCPDQQQCDTECRRNHQCKICNKTRAEVEEQDEEQGDCPRCNHPWDRHKGRCRYQPDMSGECGCRAKPPPSSSEIKHAESVAPPSLPQIDERIITERSMKASRELLSFLDIRFERGKHYANSLEQTITIVIEQNMKGIHR